MYKKIVLSLALMLLGADVFAANTRFGGTYKNSWEFMQDTFITKPQNDLRAFSVRAGRYAAIALGTCAGVNATYAFDEWYQDKYAGYSLDDNGFKDNYNNWCQKAVISAGSIGSYAISSWAVNRFMRSHFEHKALREFMAAWPQNKQFTPQTLHAAFDEVYKLYTGNMEQFNRESSEIIRALKRQIRDNGPKTEHQPLVTVSVDSRLLGEDASYQDTYFDYGALANRIDGVKQTANRYSERTWRLLKSIKAKISK